MYFVAEECVSLYCFSHQFSLFCQWVNHGTGGAFELPMQCGAYICVCIVCIVLCRREYDDHYLEHDETDTTDIINSSGYAQFSI